MGEVLGVLTEKDGRQVFQAKSEIVEATPERLATLPEVFGTTWRKLLRKSDAD